MSMKIEDGGCAFPTDNVSSVNSDGNRRSFSPGMSLRDWFAGQALPSIIGLIGIPEDGPDDLWNSALAAQSYAVADAMLTARSAARSA